MTFAKQPTATVYGIKFHALAQKLTAQLRADRGADRDDQDALLVRLYDLGAAALLEELLTENKVDSASALTTAFHALCERLVQLRGLPGVTRRYDQIFLAEEYALRDVALETSAGKMFVSGTIDSLRLADDGSLVVVDYKLSRGEQLDKELIQIALYRWLLRAGDPSLKISGLLEYLLPQLHVTELSEQELERAYQDVVAPIIAELVAARRGAATNANNTTKPELVSASPTARLPLIESAIPLGMTYGYASTPVCLELPTLLRHGAVLGGSGSGKTTLVLRIVEETLARGVPVLLIDRKGDLARYADPAAAKSQPDSTAAAALTQLQNQLDIALFTPGHSSGRPLRFNLVPTLDGLTNEDRQLLLRSAAQTLAKMLKLKQGIADETKRALLLRALEFSSSGRDITSVGRLIQLLESGDPSFGEFAGVLNKESAKLLLQLRSFEVMNQELLKDDGEPLDTEHLLALGPERIPGKTRLCIVSTRFFDSEDTALFWVAQLVSELNRYAARKPAAALQALIVFDEADVYLPAQRQPPTKGPMESLLKRARSAGLGVLLATQSPGDLDYRCRENVLTWLIGRVKEPTALDKLKPLAGGAGIDPGTAFPKQKIGQFHLITESSAKAFQADRSLLATEQLSEREILALAKGTLVVASGAELADAGRTER